MSSMTNAKFKELQNLEMINRKIHYPNRTLVLFLRKELKKAECRYSSLCTLVDRDDLEDLMTTVSNYKQIIKLLEKPE